MEQRKKKVFEKSLKTLLLMLSLDVHCMGKRYIFTKRLIARKKITSIKTQASESIFLHEFSIYIHFYAVKNNRVGYA